MFVGRKRELALLAEAMSPGETVALVGASGTGKSELARAFVAQRSALWVDCGGSTVEEIAFRLGEQEADEAGVAPEVLVLDDWSAEVSLAQIRDRFEGAVLVTTPVAPPDVASLPVPAFDVPSEGDLGASEAFELFVGAANHVRLGSAAEFEPEAVLEIIRRVAGHPLGIVLAARYAAAVGAAEVARLMSAGTDLVDESRIPRQRSMNVALEFSWNQLGPRNQEVLYLASQFERTVRVVTLAEISGRELADVLDAVRELTQCGALLPGPFPRAVRVWRDVASKRFVDERPADADALADAIFAHADAAATKAIESSVVGPIDDTPSVWEAALTNYQARESDAVGRIVFALLKWSHRFAPSRYTASSYLREVAMWSHSANATLIRAALSRGVPEQHAAAIEDATNRVTTPSEVSQLLFERAMAASIRGDSAEALEHLSISRTLEENWAAMLLEVSLLMARDDFAEAARILARLDELEPPSRGHALVAEYHRTWLLPPGERLEKARALVREFEKDTPRISARAYRCLADVLERDHGKYDEARALRRRVLDLALTIDHRKLAEDMRCELAWGAFCSGDLGAAREIASVDRDHLTAETKLRHAAVLAMIACIDADMAAARLALGDANRTLPNLPNVLGVFDVIDAAVALEDGGDAPGEYAAMMRAAIEARHQGHRDQLALHNELRKVREQPEWSARFAVRWMEAHGSPFLQRLFVLEGRRERVVVLSDGTGLRVDGEWYHVPPTSAAMLRALGTGRQMTFEELKDAAWPGETATWSSVVNRINVRVSKLRGMGLKSVLRKTSDGFVLDCTTFIEPAD